MELTTAGDEEDKYEVQHFEFRGANFRGKFPEKEQGALCEVATLKPERAKADGVLPI